MASPADGSTGELNTDAQVGVGIGPNEGDHVPNAAATTGPAQAGPPPAGERAK